MKIVAMIPARLQSKRVPKKNLRLLNGKPLIAYSIEAAKKSEVFDEIYINSEAEIFREIAEDYGVNFYKRPEMLSSDKAINDEFAIDFVNNVSADILVQLLPTSPLVTHEEIKDFVNCGLEKNYDTLVSVEDHQIACLYNGKPVNFSTTEPHKPSQTMIPVQSYATVLMLWTYKSFKKNIKNLDCAYHGGKSKIGYYTLKGLSTIDIDNEEDFALAEVAIKYKQGQKTDKKEYYQSKKIKSDRVEIDVPEILKSDGIQNSDFQNENSPLVNIDEIIESQDSSRSWCVRVVNTENNSATLIAQLPGEGNRLHYHPHWNEWWYIIAGEWQWEIEGKKHIVKANDMVFIEKNKRHKITAAGDKMAIRLAISRADVAHVYPGDKTNDH